MQKFLTLGCAAVLAVAMLSPAVAQKPDEYMGDPYTLDFCPVSGEELGSMGPPVLLNHEGRDIRFCCAGCKPRFQGEPEKYVGEIDAEMIADQKEHYPLDTDVVSGELLPAEDEIMDIVFFNRLVRLGSQKSAQKFFRNPPEYIAKLDEAVIEAQNDSYPLTTCVVSGESLDAMGEPIQKVYANRLVQFCCAGCIGKFWEEPATYLSMIEEGQAAGGGGHTESKEGSDHKKH